MPSLAVRPVRPVRSIRSCRRGLARRHPAVTAALCLITGTALLTGCGVQRLTPAQARTQADRSALVTQSDTGEAPVDCRKAKCIALTFDAGPGPRTAELLDILKAKKVHATFFLLGKNHVLAHPDLVRREAAEGHEIGNHTWTHQRLDHLTPDRIRDELDYTQDAIKKITGKAPTLMRPPQGGTNKTVGSVARSRGLSEVLWSATASDYATTDTRLIGDRILNQASRDGIILLHDIYDGTVPAVPRIVDELRARGYTFVTVPQLLAPASPQPGTVYHP
ncbi:polysaccharide deacetylase family protein [Streptomyces telluris]|uniref:Polysaccharide deacetylase family protein n=1 Tax=Streptomyces telluris TaxID=2720021 RepID=A0A9X2LKS5_9ACTN|nr:polysaccharide deacetylase family protein [Streptomyces telluris]MCQ8773571.1 polysaccharide deacetylase family protein [Streptomyces telluris]NJP81093.1 polysaccharide deacetylase family protein [Streptomyces telluris]